MAWGAISQRRKEMYEQSQLIWSLDQINAELYLFFGIIEGTGRGGPPRLSAKLEAAVEAEADRIRAANHNLPKVSM